MDAAYSIWEEDAIGTLEVGKPADLAVIEQSILEVDPPDVSDTRVLRTYFGGDLVYRSEE